METCSDGGGGSADPAGDIDHLPQGHAMHQGVWALSGLLIMPEPRGEAHAEHRVMERVEHVAQHRGQAACCVITDVITREEAGDCRQLVDRLIVPT